MTDDLPDLPALALFVAVVEEGGLGAGARRRGLHQPNASRLIARLEAQVGARLIDRHPQGARPTETGLRCLAQARRLLDAAETFMDWRRTIEQQGDVAALRVGASLTIAEHLMPAWLAALRRRAPAISVDPSVQNSAAVLAGVREGRLPLGFVETPHLPGDLQARTVRDDELVLVIAPDHPWAERSAPVTLDELVATPLVVREDGSGTREALETVVGARGMTAPAQILRSNAAVRIAVRSGAGPAVLSALAVQDQLRSGELLRVPLAGAPVRRPLTAVWNGPRRPPGAAARLLEVAEAG